jgi:hydrogenase maturation protein HypF
MTQKKDRDRVMAEITLSHLLRLANEHGCSVSREQALAFLNQRPRRRDLGRRNSSGSKAINTSAWSTFAPLGCRAAMLRSAKLERSAASLLFEIFGGEECRDSRPRLSGEPSSPAEEQFTITKVYEMLARKINVVPTTSVGRLFDAVSSIAGLAHQNRFEGQAAMLLESEIGALCTEEAYALSGGDWASLISDVVNDSRASVPISRIAARFHNALVNWIVELAEQVAEKQIVLSGGVLQNRYLTDRAARLLEARGFVLHTHQQVPPNDGDIALGQAVMARL